MTAADTSACLAEQGPGPSGRVARAAILLAVLLPAMPWLLDLPRFGALQYNDYYGIVAQVLDEGLITADPARWLTIKSNEHTVTIPALLYAANYWLSAGDNRILSLLAIAFAAGCALLVGAMVRRAAGGGAGTQATATLAAAALWFAPTAVHSYVMGFSGAIWITANLFAVLAMWSLLRMRREDAVAATAAPIAFGIAGALSYTTNLSLWPALLLGAAFAGLGWRKVAAIAAGAAAVFVAQWLLRARPEHHPETTFAPFAIAKFAAAYLGWPVTGAAASGRFAGYLGVGLAAAAAALLARDRARRAAAAPFVMLAVYGLGNALGTAVGRSALGIESAPASRYYSLAAAFWLGALGLAWQALAAARPRFAGWPRLAGPAPLAAAAAAVLVACAWVHGGPMRTEYLDRAAWQGTAVLALQHGILDDHEVLSRVNCAPEQFAAVPWLQTMRHVPFDAPRPIRHLVRVDARRLRDARDPRVAGNFDGLRQLGSGAARATGWAAAREGTIAETLLLDPEGFVRGDLTLGHPRSDVAAAKDPAWRFSGVAGYAFATEHDLPLRIWVRLRGDGHYSPLPGEHALAGIAGR